MARVCPSRIRSRAAQRRRVSGVNLLLADLPGAFVAAVGVKECRRRVGRGSRFNFYSFLLSRRVGLFGLALIDRCVKSIMTITL